MKAFFTFFIAALLAGGTTQPAYAQGNQVTLPPPWANPSDPAIGQGGASEPDLARELPSAEKLLRDHLAGGEPAPANQRGNANRPPPASVAGSGAVKGSAPQDSKDDLGSAVAAAVKDVVKPIHQEIANSAVVQAVRDLDATISGKAPSDPAATRVTYEAVGSPAANATRSPAGKPSGDAAALMWEQFVADVLPWALAVAFLAMSAWGAFQWFKYQRQKKLQPGVRRRITRRSGSRRSRRGAA